MVGSRTSVAAILVFVFTILTASAAAQSSSQTLTAAEVMQRVIAATGATPPPDTVDTLKAGDPVAFHIMRPSAGGRGHAPQWTTFFVSGALPAQ